MLLLLSLSCVEYSVEAVRDGFTPVAGEESCPPQIPDCEQPEAPDTGEMPWCEVEHADAREVPADSSCEDIPTVDEPFALHLDVHYPAKGSGVGVAPAIADLDGDGQPEMVWTEWVEDRLVVASADGGGRLWSKSSIQGAAGVALGDIDDDGTREVVTLSKDRRAVVFNHEGVLVWSSEPLPTVSVYAQPTFADVNGDGLPEVVMDNVVLSGQDGTVLVDLGGSALSRAPLAVDLDGDGADEVLIGPKVLKGGEVAWSSPTMGFAAFSVPVQLDDDPRWEVIVAATDELFFHDDDGVLLGRQPLAGEQPGPPCVGDFDGDGGMEIGVPSLYRVTLFELDGSVAWESWAQDSSGLAGCAAFDLDADGDDELIYADHQDLLILDGHSGQRLARWEDHDSFTIWETPAIADVDGDGSAEICFGSNNGEVQGVSCLGHPQGAWPAAGGEWSYNHRDGERVRGRRAIQDYRAPDLTGRMVDLCVDCFGDVEFTVQVWNEGALDQPGTPYAIYALDAEGERLIQEGALPLPEPGLADGSHALRFPAEEAGALGFALVLDGEDLYGECDEDNNRIEVIGAICP